MLRDWNLDFDCKHLVFAFTLVDSAERAAGNHFEELVEFAADLFGLSFSLIRLGEHLI